MPPVNNRSSAKMGSEWPVTRAESGKVNWQRHGGIMIARHWRGWTEVQDADAYESLLKDKVLPSLRGIEGYKGGYILRSDGPQEVEFVIVNFFDSLESVKRFAGSDYSVPVFE